VQVTRCGGGFWHAQRPAAESPIGAGSLTSGFLSGSGTSSS
jgi:hypothetical protein